MTARKGKGAEKSAALLSEITAAFIAALEDGLANPAGWTAPWHTGALQPRNAATGKAYRGMNALWLAFRGGGEWATYRQWAGLDAQVRKGERGTTIFRPMSVVKDKDEDGMPLDEPRTFVVYTTATVFSAAQVDGYVPAPVERVAQADDPAPRFDAWAANLGGMGVTLCHVSAGRAYYAPGTDTVTLPPVEDFHTLAGYRATLAHEYAHATGHADRLARDGITGAHPFGSPGYALEELVAELTSAAVGMSLGIATELRDDHRDYLASWIRALKNDPAVLRDAARDASAATDWLMAYDAASVQDAA